MNDGLKVDNEDIQGEESDSHYGEKEESSVIQTESREIEMMEDNEDDGENIINKFDNQITSFFILQKF